MKKSIYVIGCGRWGSFICYYLNSIGFDTTIYGRKESESFKHLQETHSNEYLKFNDSVKYSSDLNDALNVDYIIISIPSQNLSSLCKELAALNLKNKTVILCMKGIEISTGKRLTEIAKENLDQSNKIAVWLGPGHVQSFLAGIPNCMVIDSENEETKKELVENFSSNLIRFYYGTDLIGNEIGAAAKNIIGIGAGILDGLNLSSLKGPLMARSPREIARLIKKLGGNDISAYGLCHLGDYEATLFSKNSHNRMFGEKYAKGEKFDKLAEGYYTTKAIVELGKKLDVDLPICNALYKILYENVDIKKAINELFTRDLKKEFY